MARRDGADILMQKVEHDLARSRTSDSHDDGPREAEVIELESVHGGHPRSVDGQFGSDGGGGERGVGGDRVAHVGQGGEGGRILRGDRSRVGQLLPVQLQGALVVEEA